MNKIKLELKKINKEWQSTIYEYNDVGISHWLIRYRGNFWDVLKLFSPLRILRMIFVKSKYNEWGF